MFFRVLFEDGLERAWNVLNKLSFCVQQLSDTRGHAYLQFYTFLNILRPLKNDVIINFQDLQDLVFLFIINSEHSK